MRNPYEHADCDSDFGGCGDKCKRSAYNAGVAEGLRMAAEIAGGVGLYDSGLRTRNAILDAILAKAKEVEEAKGGN